MSVKGPWVSVKPPEEASVALRAEYVGRNDWRHEISLNYVVRGSWVREKGSGQA